ncbi:flagellar biosynthesis anti-sigma factor FlgM [Pseudoalteromonas mariniglutinosa]|uniref:flagellar biosynthesis anti-sigma factor FlgM n=1 Tax=Pseudoalteromonas mariniglutinosa TaxID=206042 RepID=UPI00384CE888
MNITNKSTLSVEQNQKVSNTLEQPALPENRTEKQQAHNQSNAVNQVSALSKSVDATFETLASKPDVDMQKVADVKAAIANGEFQLDEASLVEALLEMHKK